MTTPLVRIVDDDADARSSSSFFLSMMGLEIKEYESAQRFLGRVRRASLCAAQLSGALQQHFYHRARNGPCYAQLFQQPGTELR